MSWEGGEVRIEGDVTVLPPLRTQTLDTAEEFLCFDSKAIEDIPEYSARTIPQHDRTPGANRTKEMGSTQKSAESGMALQKYLLLHSQHDALQKHLDQITTSYLTTSPKSRSPTRNRYASLSSSPSSDNETYLSLPPQVARNHHRGGSIPQSRPRPVMKTRRSSLPTVIDESILGEIEQDEMKLKDVNQQIKSTLTELLNCEGVRGDRRYRMWIQTRLMDAEKELKKDRSKSCDRRRTEDMSGMMF